uniref:Uncharacterized protein n=1 Tax=Vespula pensylvanica TaxID=30213 RepID=A0A834NS80_VESPE|nr:hypothetical protein H0235_011469 [Vespula pensylvanica]
MVISCGLSTSLECYDLYDHGIVSYPVNQSPDRTTTEKANKAEEWKVKPVEERNFVAQLTPFTLEMVPNWWYTVVIAGTLITYAETSTVRKSNNTLAVVRGNTELRIFTSS